MYMINIIIPVSIGLISLHIGRLHFFVSLPVPLAFKQQPPCILHPQQKGNFSLQSEEPKIKYTYLDKNSFQLTCAGIEISLLIAQCYKSVTLIRKLVLTRV